MMNERYFILCYQFAGIPVEDTPPDSRECSTSPPSSYGSSPPPATPHHRFSAPRRPALGSEGRNIALRANHLEVRVLW